MQEVIADTIAEPRLQTRLLGVFRWSLFCRRPSEYTGCWRPRWPTAAVRSVSASPLGAGRTELVGMVLFLTATGLTFGNRRRAGGQSRPRRALVRNHSDRFGHVPGSGGRARRLRPARGTHSRDESQRGGSGARSAGRIKFSSPENSSGSAFATMHQVGCLSKPRPTRPASCTTPGRRRLGCDGLPIVGNGETQSR
jgi:hypothetical protein